MGLLLEYPYSGEKKKCSAPCASGGRVLVLSLDGKDQASDSTCARIIDSQQWFPTLRFLGRVVSEGQEVGCAHSL